MSTDPKDIDAFIEKLKSKYPISELQESQLRLMLHDKPRSLKTLIPRQYGRRSVLLRMVEAENERLHAMANIAKSKFNHTTKG